MSNFTPFEEEYPEEGKSVNFKECYSTPGVTRGSDLSAAEDYQGALNKMYTHIVLARVNFLSA